MGVFVEPPVTGPGIFPNPPKDSGRGTNVAAGPRLGWQGAFQAALDAQIRSDSSRGLEYTFHQTQEEQEAKIRASGYEPPPKFSDGDLAFVQKHGAMPPYFDVAKYYLGESAEPYAMELASSYDKSIAALNEAHPELQLKSSREQWDETQRRSQAAARRYDTSTSASAGAGLASLAGSMAGSFNPESDPFNFALNAATLGIGGSAATGVRAGLQRLAVAGVVPGVSEAINQATGVQERRRMLGLEEYGFGRAAKSVLFAAGGGVVLGGAAEAVGFGARKWFNHSANDPAPPPPVLQPAEVHGPPVEPGYGPGGRVYPRPDPEELLLPMEMPGVYGPSGLGRLREVQDLHAVENHMNDWEAGPPIEAKPSTEGVEGALGPPITQEEYARSIDPEAFRLWDKHNAEADLLRPMLRETAVSRAAVSQRAAAAKTIEDQARAVEERIAGTKNKRQVAKLTRELEELRAQRQALLPDVSMPGVPEVLRARVMRNDTKLRELVPLISRAYAAARDAWPDIMAKEARLYPSAGARQLRMGALLRRTLTEEEALGPRGVLPERAPEVAPVAPEVAAPADHEAFIAEAIARQREAILARGETSERAIGRELRDFEKQLREGLADIPTPPSPVGRPLPDTLAPARSQERSPGQPTIDGQFPGVVQNPDIVNKLPADADIVDKVAAVRVQEAKVQGDALDRFTQKLAQVLEPQAAAPLPRVKVKGADWLVEGIEQGRDLADKLGLTAEIDRLAFEGNTAVQIVNALKGRLPVGDEKQLVVQVRASLGIPSQEQLSEFLAWRAEAAKRYAQNSIQLPDGRTINPDDTMVDEAGKTITFREYLKDMNDDQEFIKAIGTCSSG